MLDNKQEKNEVNIFTLYQFNSQQW